MKIIALGFSLFLMQVFPMGWVRAVLPLGELFSGLPKYIQYFTNLAIVLALLGTVVFFFLRQCEKRYRLPETVPGLKWMVLGIGLYCLYVLVWSIAASILGGGSTFVFLQFAKYLLVPSKVCLLIGSIKVLLAYQIAKVA
ncbi:hypothetical protein QSV34_09595 [Porticoccus sp. W117]|uniref:hypothetical protein n=1 Tax=Porticoccus sp. W117 TaxID=3054777 RepID=UPI002595B14F|nr:hypothetical protein [Porticoccus sp. W117]MDM3871608.1 hypothetical protein [Porticoccus sp. W117]